MLNDIFEINFDKLPLTEGQIHFIRKVNNEGNISVLNEAFEVGREFISEYVWAIICLVNQKIKVYYRAQDRDVAVLIKEFDYNIDVAINPIRQDIWKI